MGKSAASRWSMRWARPNSTAVPNRASDKKRRPTAPAYTAFPSGLGMDWRTGEVHTGEIRKSK